MKHRVANSLQIIASTILMKARTVDSEETRRHLKDAHKRVMSVAAVQEHLGGGGGPVELKSYLSNLCEALSSSMIGDDRPIALTVNCEGGMATSREAESLGLIVTELVINCLKHAFSDDVHDGRITVSYECVDKDWKLSVTDNGMGKPEGIFVQPKSGLGTGIVKALAKQLDANVVTLSGPEGATVTVTRATFAAMGIRAA